MEEKKQNRINALAAIREAGSSIEPYFTLNEDQEEYYLNLMAYFMDKPRNLDRLKGLLILGTVGTGKTMSMEVMRKMFGGFQMANTRHIARDYAIDGLKTIDKYGRESFGRTPAGVIDYKKPMKYCFDDFGLESTNVKVYGNVANIMEEIIHDRYEQFLKHGMMTYATSNLDAEQIKKYYGERTTDRLRQMMNVISLTGKSMRQ